jgi:hypothetical protein
MKQEVVTLILSLVAAYAAICAAAYFGNRLFMYFPDPTRVAPVEAGLNGFREIDIEVADGTTLTAWHAPAKDDKPTTLYFHGNGANAPPVAYPKFKRFGSKASAFSTSTTEAMADQADGLRRKTMWPTQSRPTIT